MKLTSWKSLGGFLLVSIVLASPCNAQNTRVDVSRHSRLPKICEGLTPAKIGDVIDIPALVKEALCKGAGDMLAEYTYTVNSMKREKNKKGQTTKEETFVYEVFIPTLKSGTRTRGVLIVRSHNGVAVPEEKLDKERLRVAEKLEKEEARIARTPTPAIHSTEEVAGIKPIGMYTRKGISRSSFGMKSGGVTFGIASFLRATDLTFARKDQLDGREALVFTFTPRPGFQFEENDEYIAQLTGEIWIDLNERIVSRLIGWPAGAGATDGTNSGERPPAVFTEMMRLPQQGVWLPRSIRINGADYQTLFNGIKSESHWTNSNYFRFSTEVKDAQVSPRTVP